MSMEDIGDLCEILGEVKFEWKIKDFLSLADKIDTRYESPKFYFSRTCWRIRIYPNGKTGKASEGWISLHLIRLSTDFPDTVDFTLSLKTVDGQSDLDATYRNVYNKDHYGWGFSKFIQRSVLIERKSELLPSDVLTVICTLKNRGKNDADGSRKLQKNLGEFFANGNFSDVILKVDDHEFKCHRCVLAARSPVFLAMLTHETKEKNTGIVEIPDVESNTLSDFLNYFYTGTGGSITSQNVVKLYTVADKYQVDELKEACVAYMLKNMTVDNFCDFLSLSLSHAEKDLTDACSQFYNENTLDIILTSKWQIFVSENPVAGNELHIKQLQLNK